MSNDPEPEVGDRKVLMSSVLMDQWATRDIRGNRLTWDWGEPDAEGFYTPTVKTHNGDNIAAQARATLLDELRGEVEATLPGEVCRVPADYGGPEDVWSCCEVHSELLFDERCEDYPAEKVAVLALLDDYKGADR